MGSTESDAFGVSGAQQAGYVFLGEEASPCRSGRYPLQWHPRDSPPIFCCVDDTMVLVRYTRYGDADFDTVVNVDDAKRLRRTTLYAY